MIIFCACEKFTSDIGFVHIRRTMRYNELILMTKGTMYLAQDNVRVCVNEGDLIHFTANHLHYGWKKSTTPVEFYWLHFISPDAKSVSLPLHTHMDNCFDILERFIALKDVYSRLPEDADCAVTLLMHDIQHEINAPGASGGELADKLVAWIHSHFTERLTVAALSKEFGYNADYISRQVRLKTGMGAKSYITHCRINCAKSILLHSSLNAESVAHECGFSDSKQFYKLFKRAEGITPTEFRRTFNSEE